MSGRGRFSLAFCVALLVAILIPILAQSLDCTGCVLGLYDDVAMTQTTGLLSGLSKDIYLGIHYAPDATQELTSIEFGIAGLDPFVVVVEPMDSPTAVLGDPWVPSGIDTLTLTGGMNIAWPTCLTGDRVLAKVTLYPRTQWPEGGALRVKRRYPPGNPTKPFPVIGRCDAPFYTVSKVTPGTYLYGPQQGGPVCSVTAPDTIFGPVPIGQSRTLTFSIENTGGGILEGMVSESCQSFRLTDPFPISPDPHYALVHGERRAFALRFESGASLEEGCTVSLGSTCGTLHFTAQSPGPLPIRVLQENPGSYVGGIVTIEGQPYLPPEHHPSTWVAWLQDDSDRGLQIAGNVELANLLQDPTQRVRLRGRLTSDSHNLVLQNVEFASPTTSGHPLLEPLDLPTGDLRDPTLSGTFVRVRGTLVGKESADAGQQLWVDDGSGIVFVRALNPPELALGDFVQARGAAVQLTWATVWWPGLHVGRDQDLVSEGHLVVPAAGGSPHAVIDVPIQLQQNPTAVDALALRLVYDSQALTFQNGNCCGLTAGWENCDVHVAGPDTLVVVATGSQAIPPHSTGDVICLHFEVQTCGPSRLAPIDLSGDIAAMRPIAGRFACSSCVSDGDVNEDGILTPGDARCAFETSLHDGAVTSECDGPGVCEGVHADVDCDGEVLPSDALAIFRQWLETDGAPRECFGRPLASAADAFRIDVAHAIALASGEVAVPLERRARAGDAAFAARIDFDASRATFVELRPAPAVHWPGLGTRAAARGELRVGGFAIGLEAGAIGDWVPVGQLIFRSSLADAGIRHIEWLQRTLGEAPPQTQPPGSRGVTGIAVGLPHPNPAQRGDVAFDVAVPVGDATPFEIVVLDVRGRVVRRLHSGPLGPGLQAIRWDRKDGHGARVAAGLYIVRVRAGARVERRKLVVLE